MSHPTISINELTKTYETGELQLTVLSNISLSVNRGEFVAIIGPSGSGISTLMHILGGLDVPTSGTYLLDGQDIGSLTDDQLAEIRNTKIGFIFQAFNLLARTSAIDNVRLPMDYAGIPEQMQEKTAIEMLKKVGLSDRINHLPNQLSGGQQQ